MSPARAKPSLLGLQYHVTPALSSLICCRGHMKGPEQSGCKLGYQPMDSERQACSSAALSLA